jgi:hypothetical protein
LEFPIASSNTLGVVKTGYTTSGKNYKVNIDSNGNLYVNVPWSNTTYKGGTGISISSDNVISCTVSAPSTVDWATNAKWVYCTTAASAG